MISLCLLALLASADGGTDAGTAAAPVRETFKLSAETFQEHAVEVPTAEKGSLEALDAKNGFRDVKLGTKVAAMKGLKLRKKEGRNVVYSRAGDSKKFGGAVLEDIGYLFSNGELLSVVLLVKGDHNISATLDALKAGYGEPQQPNQFLEKYIWRGEKVVLIFDKNPVIDSAQVMLTSIEVLQRETERQASEAAGADL